MEGQRKVGPGPVAVNGSMDYNQSVMGERNTRTVSVVAPCFNEAAGVAAFLDRVRQVADAHPECRFEFLFVDDGSTDGTGAALLDEMARDDRVKLVTLSRNFGHQRAISAGLDFCSGDYVIVIDADMQDPPELIPDIVARLEEGFDLVHMVRSDRTIDSRAKRWTARGFYYMMRRWVLPELPEDAPDFKGMNRRVLEALRRYDERVRFLRGMLATLGFRQTRVSYTRAPRHAGRTKYNWVSILRFARDAIVSYSVIPLRLAIVAGAAAWVAALAAGAAMAAALLGAPGLPHPLLLFFVATQLVFTGLVLAFLGLIGEYLGCIIKETKHRPLYIIESLHNIAGSGANPVR